jgi:hypothetical protein
MPDTHEIEILLAMNEEGGVAVGLDEDDAGERIAELASDNGTLAVRVVKLKVKMSAPQITEAEVTVPDEAGETVSAEAAE